MTVNNKTKDNWAELKEEAIDVIRDFFRGDDNTDMPKVKVATSVLASYTRHEQTESAKEQTALIIGREIFENKEDYAKYIQVSVPRLSSQIQTTKALPSGS